MPIDNIYIQTIAQLSFAAQAGSGRPSGLALQAAWAARAEHRSRYWFFSSRREPPAINCLLHAKPQFMGLAERRRP